MATNQAFMTVKSTWKKLRSFFKIDIWKMINFWSGWKMQVIALVGFVLFFRLFMGTWTYTAMFIASMYLHEAGHGLVLAYGQIKYKVLLLFPLGAVAAPINEEENQKSDELPGNILSWLMHAGILVNIALMGIGTLMTALGGEVVANLGKELVGVNVLLAAFNIIPVSKLDAGQLFHIIYSSLDEENDKRLKIQLVVMGIAMLAIILMAPNWRGSLVQVFSNIGWIGFLLIYLIGVIRKASKDDVTYPESGNGMSHFQIQIHLVIYFLMVLAIFGLPHLSTF